MNITLDTGGDWFSNKEALPENDDLCLICHYNNHMEIAYYRDDDWYVISNDMTIDNELLSEEYNPDYWMPLPKGPKE